MRFSRKWLTKGFVGSFALVFLTSCGLDLENVLNPNASSSEDEDNFEYVTIPINVDTTGLVDEDEIGFALAALSCDVVIDFSESAVGMPDFTYNSTNDAEKQVKLVKYDRIKAHLRAMTCSDGILLRADFSNGDDAGGTHGSDFDTFDINDEAIFTSSDNAKRVTITQQFDFQTNGVNEQPILFNASGGFGYSQFNNGSAVNAGIFQQTVGFQIGGATAPNFIFKGLAHKGIESSSGALNISQAWECSGILTWTPGSAAVPGGPGPDGIPNTDDDVPEQIATDGSGNCDGVDLAHLKLVWIDDDTTWGGAPSASQIDAAYSAAILSGQAVKTVNMTHGSADVVAPSTPGLALGNGITGNFTDGKGGVSIDAVHTAASGYTEYNKYACVRFVDPDYSSDVAYTCSKVTFPSITQ